MLSKGSRGAVTQECGYNATLVGSIPTRGNELIFFNIYFFALVPKQKNRR